MAARLTEAVGEVASSSRLRGGRAGLWAEWATTGPRPVQFLTDHPPALQVFKYLFQVLVPFVRDGRTQRLGSLAEQVRPSVPRPPAPPP